MSWCVGDQACYCSRNAAGTSSVWAGVAGAKLKLGCDAAAAAAAVAAAQMPILCCLLTSSRCCLVDPAKQDFGGFRVVVLLPRFRPQWPPPPPVDNPEVDYHYEAS